MDLASLVTTLSVVVGIVAVLAGLSRRGEDSAGAANAIMRDTLASAMQLFEHEREAWDRREEEWVRRERELLDQIRDKDREIARLESDVKRMMTMLRTARLL